MNTVAMVVGYILLGVLVLATIWELFCWFMWPVIKVSVQLRILHKVNRLDLGDIKSIPQAFYANLKDYWSFFGGYGEGTTTYHGVCVWHHPTHPFSFGRIEWHDPPGKALAEGE